MAKETKELYNKFAALFEKFEVDSEIRYCLECDDDEPLKLKVAINCDMTATWKALKRGGAAKVRTYPCHACDVKSDDLATPNDVPCNRWCRQYHDDKHNWKCYHKEFLSDENISRKSKILKIKSLQLFLTLTICISNQTLIQMMILVHLLAHHL
jgi:hypothetical protein